MFNRFSTFFIQAQIIILIIWYSTHNSLPVVLCEIILVLLLTLNKLGKGIVLREIIAFHSTVILLLMPQVGYLFYSIENPQASLWVKYMPVSSLIYFYFIIPAVLLFNLTLLWPISNKNNTDEGSIFLEKFDSIKYKLNNSNIKPQRLILIGTIFHFVNSFLPIAFQYVGFLFFLISFTGFLMLYFMPKARNRVAFILYFIMYIAYVTLNSGMFTIVVYMGMTIFSFLFLKKNIGILWKLLAFCFILFALITIQNVKGVFRTFSRSENSAITFGNLVADEVKEGNAYFSIDKFFYIYVRANQGFYVGNVMKYIPSQKDYDDGEYLYKAFLSSFVPRLLWPDKPKAGGRFTTKYYTGNDLVGSTSMNVSPFGEAYGSFGPSGGIIYLFFLALSIRWVYIKIFILSDRFPFLIFWIPVIFFQVTYSMETDSLQIFNSVIKSVIFLTLLYYFFPVLFGVMKQPNRHRLISA